MTMRQRLRSSVWLARFPTGVALALLIGGAGASAQPTSSLTCDLGKCPSGLVSPLSPQALNEFFYRASIRASRAARHAVSFETRDSADADTAPVFAEAAKMTGDAFVTVAESSYGTSVLAPVSSVVVGEGDEPSARLSNGRLTITIVPAWNAAGLPSSAQIEQALTSHPVGPQASR
jgi:uncharacterized protein DUF4908